MLAKKKKKKKKRERERERERERLTQVKFSPERERGRLSFRHVTKHRSLLHTPLRNMANKHPVFYAWLGRWQRAGCAG